MDLECPYCKVSVDTTWEQININGGGQRFNAMWNINCIRTTSFPKNYTEEELLSMTVETATYVGLEWAKCTRNHCGKFVLRAIPYCHVESSLAHALSKSHNNIHIVALYIPNPTSVSRENRNIVTNSNIKTLIPQSIFPLKWDDKIPQTYTKQYDESRNLIEINPRLSLFWTRALLERLFVNEYKMPSEDMSLKAMISKFNDEHNPPNRVKRWIKNIHELGNGAVHVHEADIQRDDALFALNALTELFDFCFLEPERNQSADEAIDKINQARVSRKQNTSS